MGFTPNAGIMMGTRSGDIDYSVIPYIMKNANMTLETFDHDHIERIKKAVSEAGFTIK